MKAHRLLTISLSLLTVFVLTNCEQEVVDDTKRYHNEQGVYHSTISGNWSSNWNGSPYGSSDVSGEGYNEYDENPFILTAEEPISTFSIDADGGSYANIRRMLEDGFLPPKGAIRSEEIMNYFQYDYPPPGQEHPISLVGEIADCPWTEGNKLVFIGLKGREIPREEMPPANFVFLIDVSGSMRSDDKLELLKDGFTMYADYMRPQDRIAIVTYAGQAGVALPSVSGDQKDVIRSAIAGLTSGGGTNGAGGIHKAYEIAEENFIDGGNNRVILGTDGDFNVGVSGQDELIELIGEKRESGVFLSVLGVGSGNYQDGKMEQLANHGNGTYEYIDDLEQARKVFVDEFGKFYTVAKDVKIQVEFNSDMVLRYRLIGYENRLLDTEDFADDTKDAGEIGAGQSVAALYEITPVRENRLAPSFRVDFRYKQPAAEVSRLMTLDIFDEGHAFPEASENLRFASAAAGYGMMLWGSQYKGGLEWGDLLLWVGNARNYDPNGYRQEFLTWIVRAMELF